jgi:hypothetical protein
MLGSLPGPGGWTTLGDIAVPCIDDLILTKRWSMRDKDVADIRMLEALRASKGLV